MRRRSKILGCTIVALSMLGSQNLAPTQEKNAKKGTDKEAAKSTPAKTKAIIPIFSLSGSISEAPADEAFSFNPNKSKTLKEIVERMQKACKDPSVKALVLLPQDMAAGWAQVEELR